MDEINEGIRQLGAWVGSGLAFIGAMFGAFKLRAKAKNGTKRAALPALVNGNGTATAAELKRLREVLRDQGFTQDRQSTHMAKLVERLDAMARDMERLTAQGNKAAPDVAGFVARWDERTGNLSRGQDEIRAELAEIRAELNRRGGAA